MQMFLRLAAALFAVVLASTIVVQSAAEKPVNAISSDGIIFTAVVTDESDRPLNDVVVIAMLAPSEAELERSEKGLKSPELELAPSGKIARREGALNQHLVGQSVTSKSGAFSFYQNPLSVPSQYIEPDGSVNITLMFVRRATNGSSEPEWIGGYSETVYPSVGGQGPWTATAAEGPAVDASTVQPVALKFELASDGEFSVDDSAEAQVILDETLAEAPVPNNFPGENGEVQQNQGMSCSEAWQRNYFGVPVILMSAGSNSTVVRYDYSFSANDSQTLGVAISASGAFGSFSASGTKTTSTNVTINWPARTAASGSDHIYYRTKAKYSKYKETCFFFFFGQWVTTTQYEVRPRYIQGDQLWSGQSNTYPTYCSKMLPGGSFERTTGTTISYSNGVDISSTIGIDLKVTNKLSGGTSHKIKFENIASTKNRYVCGQYGHIGAPYTGTLMGDYKDR